jgi:hypothetical protein
MQKLQGVGDITPRDNNLRAYNLGVTYNPGYRPCYATLTAS